MAPRSPSPRTSGEFHLLIEFEDAKKTYVRDLSSFLYNLELLYDFSLMITADEYIDVPFRKSLFWSGAEIRKSHQLEIDKYQKESPAWVEIKVALDMGAAAAVIASFVLYEIRNWNRNRKEEASKQKEREFIQHEYRRLMRESRRPRGDELRVERIGERTIRRLEENPEVDKIERITAWIIYDDETREDVPIDEPIPRRARRRKD